MKNPPDHVLGFLILAAYLGWPLLIFVFELGRSGVFGALLWTALLWLVTGEFLGSFVSMLQEGYRQKPPSLQTAYLYVCLFVLLNYGLSGLRIYWLIRHPRRRKRFRGWIDELALRMQVSIRRRRRRRRASP